MISQSLLLPRLTQFPVLDLVYLFFVDHEFGILGMQIPCLREVLCSLVVPLQLLQGQRQPEVGKCILWLLPYHLVQVLQRFLELLGENATLGAFVVVLRQTTQFDGVGEGLDSFGILLPVGIGQSNVVVDVGLYLLAWAEQQRFLQIANSLLELLALVVGQSPPVVGDGVAAVDGECLGEVLDPLVVITQLNESRASLDQKLFVVWLLFQRQVDVHQGFLCLASPQVGQPQSSQQLRVAASQIHHLEEIRHRSLYVLETDFGHSQVVVHQGIAWIHSPEGLKLIECLRVLLIGKVDPTLQLVHTPIAAARTSELADAGNGLAVLLVGELVEGQVIERTEIKTMPTILPHNLQGYHKLADGFRVLFGLEDKSFGIVGLQLLIGVQIEPQGHPKSHQSFIFLIQLIKRISQIIPALSNLIIRYIFLLVQPQCFAVGIQTRLILPTQVQSHSFIIFILRLARIEVNG